MGQFRSPGAEQYFLRKKNMDRSIDLAVQHIFVCIKNWSILDPTSTTSPYLFLLKSVCGLFHRLLPSLNVDPNVPNVHSACFHVRLCVPSQAIGWKHNSIQRSLIALPQCFSIPYNPSLTVAWKQNAQTKSFSMAPNSQYCQLLSCTKCVS